MNYRLHTNPCRVTCPEHNKAEKPSDPCQANSQPPPSLRPLFSKHGSMATKRSRAAFEADQSLQPPYAFYGTPLPPLDADVRDDGSYTPVWNQEVRDERGRRRLHGAFTGGFSAG